MESTAPESLPLFQLCNFSCIKKLIPVKEGDVPSFKTVVHLTVRKTTDSTGPYQPKLIGFAVCRANIL